MQLNLVLLISISILVGLFGGKLFERLRIPRVVGYIVIGLFLGDSFTHIIPLELVRTLSPLTNLALALIGLMVGGELKKSVFQRFGRQMLAILCAEGLAAFGLVALLVSLASGKLHLGLVLGALVSATAPAATVDVLWEYRSRGP